jgi:hypothetical protein
MTMRTCIVCGRVSEGSRCPDHRRPGTTARDYGWLHQQERAAWAPIVDAGGVVCRRAQYGECIEASPVIEPGEPFDLDHPDSDHPAPKAPAHPRCNRGASRRARMPDHPDPDREDH